MTLVNKTLRVLSEGGVRAGLIHVFVADQHEFDEYLRVVPKHLYGTLVVGVVGLSKQHAFINRYFPEGKHVVSMDDDVAAVLMLGKGRANLTLVPLVRLDVFFETCFTDLKRAGLHLCGVYPVPNAFFMRPQPRSTTVLKFIQGPFYAYVNRHDSDLVCHEQEKQDYELSILTFIKDGGVLRYNHVAMKTQMADPMSRREGHRVAALSLVKRFPQYARLKVRKEGRYEIALKSEIKRKNEIT
ncbi:MAG: hypothetical protein WDW38_006382 [Sanguina aurantia]